MKKQKLLTAFALIIGILAFQSCGNSNKKTDMKTELTNFIKTYEDTVSPLMTEYCTAMWNAEISGKAEDFEKSQELGIKYTKFLSNKSSFATLKKIKESGEIKDSILLRQLNILYNTYLSNQVDEQKLEEMILMETAISQKYNKYRAVVDGDSLTDNMIDNILLTSTDNAKLQKAWEAHKNIGNIVEKDVIAIVKKRNSIAKDLGFNNYYEMSMLLSDQDPKEIEKLYNELDVLTKDAFVKVKNDIDEHLTKRYNVKKEDLKPWHYQDRFFQEAPKIYTLNLDKYYENKDLVKLTTDYYASLGMDIKDIVAKSDLFEKPGKNQHAFCISLDKKGDIRILCNLKSNAKWMNTMLHEYGHGVYDKYISRDLPFTLQDPAHTFTTEAIAMLFGRMASNAQWMQDMLGINDKEKEQIQETAFKYTRLEQLVFSRWSQVMYRFEKGMYENPDQDLNKLWWDIVEKYQLIKKPEGRNAPDWASKIHIATYPCYYHNYHLGELLASQLNHYIVTNILKTDNINSSSYFNNKEVGKYLINNVFSVGSKYTWNEMIEKATGEKLTAKYYAEQFVDGE